MNMPMHLKDYVKVYDNFLDVDLCKRVMQEMPSLDWKMHEFYDTRLDKSLSFEKELSVAHSTSSTAIELNKKLWFGVEQYILKDFSLMSNWFNAWSGYTYVRFNRYNKETQMKLHCDHIHSMFDGVRKGIPTLTILGGLNTEEEDYEGGDLILWESEKIVLKAGSIMIFPSNFMYPHRVDEVKKGTRYSFVSWIW